MMKLPIPFLIACLACLLPVEANAQIAKITIDQNNKTVKEVMDVIEIAGNVIFFYNDKDVDLNRKVSVHAANDSIPKVLDQLFKGTQNAYYMDGRQIYITRKKAEKPEIKQNTETKQEKKKIAVTGTVMDKNGETLIGATIMIAGTSEGVVTDSQGNFSCMAPEGGQLRISYIGYATESVNIRGSEPLKIVLNENTEMEEVVVVAYGTQKK